MTIDEPGYFERLARVESGHWWSRAMWRLASGWLAGAIEGRRGLVALGRRAAGRGSRWSG